MAPSTGCWKLDWAFFWVVFVSIWCNMGFYVLILLAGLQSIPSDVYEAAEMDGTPRWRQLLRITLPLLMPTMLVVMVLSVIPRGAGIRRNLCADRRRAGLCHDAADPVYLRCRLLDPATALWGWAGGGIAFDGGRACSLLTMKCSLPPRANNRGIT